MKYFALLMLAGCGSAFSSVDAISLDAATPGVEIAADVGTSTVPDSTPSTAVVPPAPVTDTGAPDASTPNSGEASSPIIGFDASVANPVDSGPPLMTCADASSTAWLCSWAGVSAQMLSGEFCLYEDLPTNKVPMNGLIPAACTCNPTCACLLAHFTCPAAAGVRELGVETNSCTNDGRGHIALSCQYIRN